MLDTKGYRHTLKLCNTYSFSTATMVARMRLSVTLYVHCLSCLGYSSGSKCQCKEFISPKQLILPSNIFYNHFLILLLGKMAPHVVTRTKLIYLLPLFLSIL